MPDITPRKDSPMRKFIRISLGILFLILGIIGLVLPILQGILFLIIGLILLAPYSPLIQRQLAAFRINHPKIYLRSQAFMGKLRSLWRSIFRKKH